MTLDENTLFLDDADQTSAFGRWLAPQLGAGDVLLLDGPVGAGKSHLARAVIQFRLAQDGITEDVPSPSFTLIQIYPLRIPIVHADLYRISSPDDSTELGLADTLDQAITLIEWPTSIVALLPKRALTLRLRPDDTGDSRKLHLSSPDPRWQAVMQDAASHWTQN
jgi:tRNA threonylcarbamoyl adenosine modification protein YjeE